MAVRGILTIIDQYGKGGESGADAPRKLRLMLRDKPDVQGVWVQAGATDWIHTHDMRYWLRMSEVIGFEVLPKDGGPL